MTIKELDILKKNGEEINLEFTDTGVLKYMEEPGMSTHYLRHNRDQYVDLINNVLVSQNLSEVTAISGVFIDDDGKEIVQEGLLGNIIYSEEKKKEDTVESS